MFKFVLSALLAAPLTFASAEAFDNFAANRAADAFAAYGVQGLALAGRARADDGASPFGDAQEGVAPSPVYAPTYTPTCQTLYATVNNGNTLMNVPVTVCR